jgi:predicted aspartyl protease
MINGQVFTHRALISIFLRVPNQPDTEVEFIVDTGFTGFLTLPPGNRHGAQSPFRPMDICRLSGREHGFAFH